MKNSSVRVGVIGLGYMGRNHVRVYSELPRVTLAGVADRDTIICDQIARRYGVKGYKDYKEMLNAERPDAVSIAVPTHAHFEVASTAIRAGASVLVEKPITATVEEGQQLIRLAAAANVILGVGHVERFNPVIAAIKQALTNDAIGRTLQIVIRRIGPRPTRVRDSGVFLDLATHDVDILSCLTESEVVSISAESIALDGSSHEDLGAAMVRFSNGVIGVIIVNWVSPTKIREVMVTGERGMLVADTLTQDLYQYDNDYSTTEWLAIENIRGMAEGRMVRHRLQKAEPLRAELDAFVESVTGRVRFPVTGEDGLRAVKVATQMRDYAIRARASSAVQSGG